MKQVFHLQMIFFEGNVQTKFKLFASINDYEYKKLFSKILTNIYPELHSEGVRSYFFSGD